MRSAITSAPISKAAVMPPKQQPPAVTNARDVLAGKRLIAIIHPDNVPSQRVAQKIGSLPHERDATSRSGTPVRIYATAL